MVHEVEFMTWSQNLAVEIEIKMDVITENIVSNNRTGTAIYFQKIILPIRSY